MVSKTNLEMDIRRITNKAPIGTLNESAGLHPDHVSSYKHVIEHMQSMAKHHEIESGKMHGEDAQMEYDEAEKYKHHARVLKNILKGAGPHDYEADGS